MATSTKTSATDAEVYTAASGVIKSAGNKIADFEGLIQVSVGFNPVFEDEQERFPKTVWFDSGLVTVVIGEVTWLFTVLNKLWNITANGSDTLADGSTAATSYTITQATYPPKKELLLAFTHTGDQKAVEIFGDRVIVPSLAMPFPQLDITDYDVQFIFMGDGSDNVIKISKEN